MKGVAQDFGPVNTESLGPMLNVGSIFVWHAKAEHRHTIDGSAYDKASPDPSGTGLCDADAAEREPSSTAERIRGPAEPEGQRAIAVASELLTRLASRRQPAGPMVPVANLMPHRLRRGMTATLWRSNGARFAGAL